jgi:hypothetical protein
MRRQITLARDPDFEGTQESQNEGAALAVIAQPDYIRAMLTVKAFLDEFGGEAYVAAYREKFDAEGNKIPAELHSDKSVPGNYETLGYVVHIESVAKNTEKITGAPKEQDARLTTPHPLLPEDPEDNSTEPNHKDADAEVLASIEAA